MILIPENEISDYKMIQAHHFNIPGGLILRGRGTVTADMVTMIKNTRCLVCRQAFIWSGFIITLCVDRNG